MLLKEQNCGIVDDDNNNNNTKRVEGVENVMKCTLTHYNNNKMVGGVNPVYMIK